MWLTKIYNEYQRINKNLRYLIIVCILLGIIIRLINLWDSGYLYDTNLFSEWATNGLNLNPFNFWRDYKDFFDYLPLSLFYLTFIKFLANIFSNSYVSFLIIFKLFNLLFDIGLFVCIVYIAKKYGKFSVTKSYLIGLIAFLGPSLWFVSAFWGQLDTLLVLIGLSSVLLIYRSLEKPSLSIFALYSGIFFGCGICFKLEIILILPSLVLFHLIHRNFKIFSLQILGTLISIFLINLGPILVNASRVLENYQVPLHRTDYINNGAQNLWALIGHVDPNEMGYNILFRIGSFSLSVNNFATGMFLLILVIFTLKIIRLSNFNEFKFKLSYLQKVISQNYQFSFFDFALFTTISSATYYMLMTKMHERYFHTAIIFGIVTIAAMSYKTLNKRYFIILNLLLACSYFINLINIYHYHNGSISPLWVQYFFDGFGFDSDKLSAIINLVSVLGIYVWGWIYLSRNLEAERSKSKSIVDL